MDSLPFYQEVDVASGTRVWAMLRWLYGHSDELCGFLHCIISVNGECPLASLGISVHSP